MLMTVVVFAPIICSPTQGGEEVASHRVAQSRKLRDLLNQTAGTDTFIHKVADLQAARVDVPLKDGSGTITMTEVSAGLICNSDDAAFCTDIFSRTKTPSDLDCAWSVCPDPVPFERIVSIV